jgi:hypothetical protein
MNLLAKFGLFGLLAGTASALYADPAGGWLSPNGVNGASGTGAAVSGQAQVGVTATVGVTTTMSLLDIQLRGTSSTCSRSRAKRRTSSSSTASTTSWCRSSRR